MSNRGIVFSIRSEFSNHTLVSFDGDIREYVLDHAISKFIAEVKPKLTECGDRFVTVWEDSPRIVSVYNFEVYLLSRSDVDRLGEQVATLRRKVDELQRKVNRATEEVLSWQMYGMGRDLIIQEIKGRGLFTILKTSVDDSVRRFTTHWKQKLSPTGKLGFSKIFDRSWIKGIVSPKHKMKK